MRQHFAALAPQYRHLRDLDMRAVRRVAGLLRGIVASQSSLSLLDVGTGTGRYTQAVLHELPREGARRPRVVAVDATREMLGALAAHLPFDIASVQRVIGRAEDLPFAAAAFDALLSFNALHHFDLPAFLREAARVVRPSGTLLLYTRTPEQNRRTVWGRFFPEFAARETRLYSEGTLRAAVAATGCFRRIQLLPLRWVVRTSLARLLDQARLRFYSTFELYTPREFAAALGAFERRVRAHYRDPMGVTAQHDHLLVHATRR
jgi:ubiquinone/menaquinone biosynthesis C-methylase UbiE